MDQTHQTSSAEVSDRPAASPRDNGQRQIVILGAKEHNLRNIDVRLPRDKMVIITGLSGSGKSSLVFDILDRALRQRLYGAGDAPGEHEHRCEYLNYYRD